MKAFDLETYLHSFYASFPEAQKTPVIGITSNYVDGDVTLRDRYYKQIIAAGGTPVIIPPSHNKEVLINTLESIDGLLLTGGGDYNPLWGGEDPVKELHSINAERDLPELLITRLAFNRQIPMLGICRGIQTMAMALGGTVKQDINGEATIKHSQDAERTEPTHTINIEEDSILYNIYGEKQMAVNSFHHQVVATTGPHFRQSATSPDGFIEAIESCESKHFIGVQWHPEWLEEDGLKLFKWLVESAKNYADAKQAHKQIITLDTHCDTPMFFPQGIDFGSRDNRILYDLHKMNEGRTDAVTMVAYLPQPKDGEKFEDIVELDAKTPKAYADKIFDEIGNIINSHADYIAQARTPEDIARNKAQGKKSILIGIENGLAIEDNIENVNHFAKRGITYITLCHNGDNQICDSARRSNNTHNGVSQFGAKVINRMNELGIMVDLSHAGEKSFYDAIDISNTPIVCSHSNCKALCDVPRNLTDDQLRALAKQGGVMQVTLYNGFLVKDGQASIIDAMKHLDHAIKIMGIDHVGIGTDFDGDGGVPGCANASELINFTMHLLNRKYSIEDISKIWGGNWMRVMKQVQYSAK